VNFEWDEWKNQLNFRKHGLYFGEAWEVFKTPYFLDVDTRNDYGEDRLSVVGLLGNRVVVVIFTVREGETFVLFLFGRH
jgi:uncharacterized protein